jgi:predicted DNA-binding transcriptional regulator AlpA
METTETHLPTRLVQRRYGVSDRTLDRWLKKVELSFPSPFVINGRRYWRVSDLEAWESRWPRPEQKEA